ncbi:MAG: hypothetical protein IKB59_00760 [Alphaproteobacteria bacterium]|nr:hypothetical protein [Alphaproteobacteria bacterium]
MSNNFTPSNEYNDIVTQADEYSKQKSDMAGIREQERLDKAYENMMKRRKKIKGFFSGVKKLFTKQKTKDNFQQHER